MKNSPGGTSRRALVMGASGFVGSHVVRKLVERGDDVRVFLRKTSSTVAIDDLDVERCYGDLYDEAALRAAMADRDVVYYCIVDTRFYLRDPAPLFETNVTSLQRVLDVASDADLHRFVFCSTIGTIALGNPATEDDPFNWHGKGGAYIESRRTAEDMVLQYATDGKVPAVAMCVSNPYGPRDWQPSQGMMVKYAALGKIPMYVNGVSTEVVGIEDVADAFLLAGSADESASATSSRRHTCRCGSCSIPRRRRWEPNHRGSASHFWRCTPWGSSPVSCPDCCGVTCR